MPPTSSSSAKATSSSSSSLHHLDPRLKDLFLRKYQRTGIALTASQLIDLAKQRKILPLPSKAAVHRFIREDVNELGAFTQPTQLKRKSNEHQTIGVPRSGVYFIDYGEFHKEWAGSNNRCTGFLVCVENLTNKLFVAPTQGKNTQQWLNSIAQFVENTRDIKLMYSDRDSVAISSNFRDNIRNKYKIRWEFLVKGNKAYLAERYIEFVKRKLSQALASPAGEKNRKRWIDFVPELISSYNNERIGNTQFKRGGVTQANFDTFVGQLFKVSDPSLSRYNAFKAGPFENKTWNKVIFKFDLGDKVRVLNSANWKDKKSLGLHAFSKASTTGSFSNKVYTVSGRQLRANSTYKRMIPVYSLSEFGERHLHFYENELARVGTLPTGSGAREDD